MSDKKNTNNANVAVQCLIGNGIEFNGDLNFSGGLHIDGHVIGSIESKLGESARMTLSNNGVIDGSVKTSDAEINGTINGDVHATGSVVLHPQSHVNGNVYYKRIEIRRGACINGKLIATHEKAQKSSILDKFNPVRKSA